MLELLLTRLRERDVDLYLVRVFYRARQTLAKAGFIELLGEDHMWHSISAGVRAAKSAAKVKGKPHAQVVDEPDDGDVPDSAERIAVDDEPEPEVDPEVLVVEKAPRGGYQDPHLTAPQKARKRSSEANRGRWRR
jgi:hypothetical protein